MDVNTLMCVILNISVYDKDHFKHINSIISMINKNDKIIP